MLPELQGQSLACGGGVWPPVHSTPVKERHYNKTTEPGDVFDVATMGGETGLCVQGYCHGI